MLLLASPGRTNRDVLGLVAAHRNGYRCSNWSPVDPVCECESQWLRFVYSNSSLRDDVKALFAKVLIRYRNNFLILTDIIFIGCYNYPS